MEHIEFTQYFVIVAATLFASILGGVTGYGTGLLLPPVLIPIIGAEAIVPVIGLASLLTNASRVAAFWSVFDFAKFKLVVFTALPTTVLGAYGYSLLSGQAISVLIGTMLIILVPLRRILKTRQVVMSDGGVRLAGVGYGFLNGGTSGSGVVLISLLLGAGLSGTAVIATDAGISLVLGSLKSLTFLGVGALPWSSVMMALLIGVCAMPGAFIAKRLAIKLPGQVHILILDTTVIIGGSLLILRGILGS